MGLKEIKDRIKTVPRIWIYLFAALVSFLILIGMRSAGKSEDVKPEEPAAPLQSESCEEKLERRLSEMISDIKGAGDAKVMVTFYGGEEKVFAENKTESDGRTETETVIVGSKEALLKQSLYPEVRGVTVICPGGDVPGTKEKVVNAVSTVLDIPTSKVYVTKSK